MIPDVAIWLEATSGQIQDGGLHPNWRYSNHNNSADCLTSLKFRTTEFDRATADTLVANVQGRRVRDEGHSMKKRSILPTGASLAIDNAASEQLTTQNCHFTAEIVRVGYYPKHTELSPIKTSLFCYETTYSLSTYVHRPAQNASTEVSAILSGKLLSLRVFTI